MYQLSSERVPLIIMGKKYSQTVFLTLLLIATSIQQTRSMLTCLQDRVTQSRHIDTQSKQGVTQNK